MPWQAGPWKATVLAKNNNRLPVALTGMGNRPPSTTVATVAKLSSSGYLAYAAYNYQQGDSGGDPVVEVASSTSADPVDDDVEQEEHELADLVVEDSSHISVQSFIQTFVAVLAVLLVITGSVTVAQPSPDRPTNVCATVLEHGWRRSYYKWDPF